MLSSMRLGKLSFFGREGSFRNKNLSATFIISRVRMSIHFVQIRTKTIEQGWSYLEPNRTIALDKTKFLACSIWFPRAKAMKARQEKNCAFSLQHKLNKIQKVEAQYQNNQSSDSEKKLKIIEL